MTPEARTTQNSDRQLGQRGAERFAQWLSDRQQLDSDGGEFPAEQMQWLVAIKDHIASSLVIEQDDFEHTPFNQFGGIGRANELFGDCFAEIMEELNVTRYELQNLPVLRTHALPLASTLSISNVSFISNRT